MSSSMAILLALLVLALFAEVQSWEQVIVTTSDDGTSTWTTRESDEFLPQVEAKVTQRGALKSGNSSAFYIGGPIPFTGSNDKTLSAAAHVRAAVDTWVSWVDREYLHGLVGGQPLDIWATWMDDKGDPQMAANATAWLNRYVGTNIFIAGIVDDRVRWSALQAYYLNAFLISPGASDPEIYKELGSDRIFGLMPPPRNKIEAQVAALEEIAEQADAAYAASGEENVCGTAGCRSSLALSILGICTSVQEDELSMSVLFNYLGKEEVDSSTSEEDLRAALQRLQAKGTNVLQICGLTVDGLQDVTLLMELLAFDVWAIFSDTVHDEDSSTYTQQMTSGWFQGAWIMDATPWHPKYPTRGSHSDMTSAEFAQLFKQSSGFEATPYAASAFACLIVVSKALEAAWNSYGFNLTLFRDEIQKTSMDEFFGNIQFDEYGQNTQPFLVTQYSNVSGGDASTDIVHPFAKASASVVFPRPSWPQMRCRYETAVLSQECSGKGLCDRTGTCVCNYGWAGDTCSSEESAEKTDHMTLILIVVLSSCGFAIVMVLALTVCRHILTKRRRRIIAEKEALARAIEVEDKAGIEKGKFALLHLGIPPFAITDFDEETRREQSEKRGIRLSYILSDEFLELAQKRTGLEDPTFYDMKDKFFFGDDALGKDQICPRDGKPGVALVDWVDKEWRGPTTHFLSWTWGYKVSLVRDALEHWTDTHGIDPKDVCLFMCFFVNNQYRIIVSKERIGAEQLEHIFEENLTRIGHVVALLDTWDSPRYLTRIWTIFEQAMSIQLKVPVTMVLPRNAASELMEEFNKGKDGIVRVSDSLTTVDSESAEAYSPDDEKAVKELIKQKLGFETVNQSIFKFMTKWVGLEMEVHLRDLVGKRGSTTTRGKPSRIVLS